MEFRGTTPELSLATRSPGILPARIAASRMLIIEANRTKAELLHYYCAAHWGFEIVGVERTYADGVAGVSRSKPDLVIASLAAADLGSVDFVQQLRLAAPSAKLVLLTSISTEYLIHALSALEWNALVFEADEGLVALGQAIDRVRQGARYVSSRIVQCQSAMRANPLAFHKILSAREQEVLVCIANSLADEEIGRLFGLSKNTVQSHRKEIMRKLDIHSTPKLIRYCAEKGFNALPLPAAPLAP
ncbi:MAG: response regulator transcription factor [Lacunisphaera sp.]|nr:response regulator transcription factor [Lacunisphaera sp.]